MLHLENSKVPIWGQEHYKEYFVLSYLVRQDKWLFGIWYGRAKKGECCCVTAGSAVTQMSKNLGYINIKQCKFLYLCINYDIGVKNG
ncbi:Uncharacterised protein [Legionella pneumophila]|uniref:hypothetical protein n=1 Tax=Legionella pneumophila TaxID=446 RepID=UPI0005CADF27|nr:hypothetical protein [Legionella pneumophila]MCZ4806619.1 hypothetical protein [Legionella pneumophila]WAI78116.1 hypothetical protein OXA86_09575 [Legionella pneumophila]CZH36985.1 Uncharacterised protein [Legionella pneumophila]CZI65090.1 Uncharacterised protein [Legionella pneumophila]HDO7809631.1 hypothetical protein [Legionella pneumophila]